MLRIGGQPSSLTPHRVPASIQRPAVASGEDPNSTGWNALRTLAIRVAADLAEAAKLMLPINDVL